MLNRASKMLLAVMAAAAPAAAQNPPAPPPATVDQAPAAAPGSAENAVLAAKAPTPVPAQAAEPDDSGRPVSSRIAADINSGMPRYSPPTPTPVAPPDAATALRDIDKPKNEIPRLPKYVVRETRPLVFRNRDLYTADGLVNLSFKNHPGLGFGNLLGLNSKIAYEMYLDEERQASIDDLSDTARAMAAGGDSAESKYILKESQETYLRPIEETWGGPGGNGGFSGGGGR